ncbi:MAG: Holliday junction branch migration protein RuvA [Anaerostipes sp.]|nr:Holliday junction branch migration protein RuvA [Anaerostipes sp.]
MISYIKGIITGIDHNHIIVENQGMGYGIMVPAIDTWARWIGTTRQVFTHMHVREDDISLFGFSSQDEKEIFELLIGVNGIGPKVALSLLATLSVVDLKMAILSDDAKTIATTPGLGPKGAKKLILELKDKFDFDDMLGGESEIGDVSDVSDDVISLTASGLTSLGYSKSEAIAAIRKVEDADTYTPEELLKQALRKLI